MEILVGESSEKTNPIQSQTKPISWRVGLKAEKNRLILPDYGAGAITQ
jgi:hypothetical protein